MHFATYQKITKRVYYIILIIKQAYKVNMGLWKSLYITI